jgi:hypothetical protein
MHQPEERTDPNTALPFPFRQLPKASGRWMTPLHLSLCHFSFQGIISLSVSHMHRSDGD